jgi:DNA adenine methylase
LSETEEKALKIHEKFEEMAGKDLKDVIADELIEYVREELGQTKTGKIIEYIGGDWFIKDEIIQLLVRSKCATLVEVFGGSGTISAYAPREVFKIIVYNDKDDLVYNFFKVLREKPHELMRELILMPFSRRLHYELWDTVRNGKYRDMSDIEKAVLFFSLNAMGFDGMIGKGFKVSKDAGRPKSRAYLRKVASLADMAKKWLDVVLENRDFREIIPLYDSLNTVFYCDPPYLSVSQAQRKDYYRLGFTHSDMKALLNLLAQVKGKFVLKLPDDHIGISYIREFATRHKIKIIEHQKASQNVSGKAREKQKTVLIYNFDDGRNLQSFIQHTL